MNGPKQRMLRAGAKNYYLLMLFMVQVRKGSALHHAIASLLLVSAPSFLLAATVRSRKLWCPHINYKGRPIQRALLDLSAH